MYGWPGEGSFSILERHPQLSSGKGTLRITHAVADDIRNEELVEIVRSALIDGDARAPKLSALARFVEVAVADMRRPRRGRDQNTADNLERVADRYLSSQGSLKAQLLEATAQRLGEASENST